MAPAVGAVALPSSRYEVHETRAGPRSNKWKRGNRVDPDAIVPLRIGLAQTNLHTGYDRLMDVSHPSSPNYGKHLSPAEVHSLFAPTDETAALVKAWLVESGIDKSMILDYENKGWVGVDLPASEAEKLFRMQYHEHEHGGELRIGCDEYSVPSHLVRHIDYITPGVKLSSPMRKRSLENRAAPSWGPGWGKNPLPHRKPPGWGPSSWKPPTSGSGLPPNLQGCSMNFTTDCYRAIYKITPSAHRTLPGNSVGLFEAGDTYSQEDLDLYYAKYAPYIPQGTAPIPAFIDGAEAPVPQDSEFNTGESDLDIAIVISLVWPQSVTLYQTDDRPQSTLESNETIKGFLNTFLDALDGSYCNYTAYGITGDSPDLDAVYPDPREGGYKGPRMCGTYKPTRVISGSYGQSELDLPKRYTQRQCNEFMKLGLQGHTFLFSSSDFGVAGFAGDVTESGCLSGSGQNQTIYNPDYPSNCPYITSVGATQLQPNQTIKDPESAMQTPLASSGPDALFSSGGGFSNYFPAPAYQAAAVKSYLARHNPGHPSYVANADASNIGEHGGIYNRAGRGYPDISANGANFRMFTGGQDFHFFGTSLAAPLWAAVVSLLNSERQAIGKGPVGFLNPVLYEHATSGILTDIKNGSNPNCGSSGFTAVDGWDPVTGLGTPVYPKLLELFLRLP